MSDPAQLLLTTHPGIEDLVAAEVRERLGHLGPLVIEERPGKRDGRVHVAAPGPAAPLVQAAMGLKTIHHVWRPVAPFALAPTEPLAGIQAEIAALVNAGAVPELDSAASFRVSSERRGQHDFGSMDVAAHAGAGVRQVRPVPVDLDDPAVNLRVDVEHQRVDVAVQYTRVPLSRRTGRIWSPRTTLKASLAHAMFRLAWPETPPAHLLDPFTGSGGILIEAASVWDHTAMTGCDAFAAPIEGAQANRVQAGLEARYDLRQADAAALDQHFAPDTFDAVVANPPFGVRLGAKVDFRRFYKDCLRGIAAVVGPGGRGVFLVLKRAAFNSALKQRGTPWRTVHVRVVEMGGLHVGMFLLERTHGRSRPPE